jgi:hypothetical protein
MRKQQLGLAADRAFPTHLLVKPVRRKPEPFRRFGMAHPKLLNPLEQLVGGQSQQAPPARTSIRRIVSMIGPAA